MAQWVVSLISPVALIVTIVVLYGAHHELQKSFDESRKRFLEEYRVNAAQLDVRNGEAPPAWVAAQTLLQTYVATNTFQVRVIFGFSLFAMLVGFMITCYGVMSASHITDRNVQFWPAALPTVAGVLTQFIGATFLYLARITNSSATAFVTILDRMNVVGMAVCVVRSIPPGAEYDELRARTYARMAQDLVGLRAGQGAALLSGAPEATHSANAAAEEPSQKSHAP